MMSDQLLSTIETIYDCIGEEFDHDRALEVYSKSTDNTGLFLAEINPVLGGFGKYYSHNIPDDAVTAMITKHDGPQTNSLFSNIMKLPDRTPILRRLIVPDEEFHTSEQYKNTCEPWGIHSDGASILDKNRDKMTICAFLRFSGQSEINEDLLCLMAVLNTHYCRAMTLHTRLDKLEQALLQSSNMLDLIEFGVVFYGRQANPIFVNVAAQRILDEKDGIAINADGLKFLDPQANRIIQDMLGILYDPKLPLGAKSGGIVVIPRVSRAKPYSALLVPLPGGKTAGIESATVAIFLFDPSIRSTAAIDLFVASYDLSRPEAELAHFLALGDSLEDAAARRGVSRNTAKTQLQSIFAKTETNRQSELVSLLLRSVAGISLKTR